MMYHDAEAIKQFLQAIDLAWQEGRSIRVELRASYRLGSARPLNIDRTQVEFQCDTSRPRVWIPEFARTSFHQWFETHFQDFEFSSGGSMLKIKATARGNAPAYSVGLKPLA